MEKETNPMVPEYNEAIKKFASERKENNVITNTVEKSAVIIQYFIKYMKSDILFVAIPDLTYELFNKKEVVNAIKEYLDSDKGKMLIIYINNSSNMYSTLFKVLIQHVSQVIIRYNPNYNTQFNMIFDGKKSYAYIRGNILRCNFCDENTCQSLLQHIEIIKRGSEVISLL